MTPLPENIEDCIGKTIKLKPNAAYHSIKNFGLNELYILDVSNNEKLSHVPKEEKINLFTKKEYEGERRLVHGLARIMGYKRIQEIFELA